MTVLAFSKFHIHPIASLIGKLIIMLLLLLCKEISINFLQPSYLYRKLELESPYI